MLYSMRLPERVVAAMLAGKDSGSSRDVGIDGAFMDREPFLERKQFCPD